MVTSLTDQLYKERQEYKVVQNWGCHLWKRRGDMIAVFRTMMGVDKTDKEDLFVMDEKQQDKERNQRQGT